jgi:PadR family transcriptional regulator, regulatory protein PadR
MKAERGVALRKDSEIVSERKHGELAFDYASSDLCVDTLLRPVVECLHMGQDRSPRIDILQGTLDLLILRTLLAGPRHGHAIAKHIQQTSEELLQVETGSLYPALHRLEAKGLIAASWDVSDKGKRARYYRLTAAGKKQLASEQSKWKAFSRAIGLILGPAEEA